jgi:hypothetical protein
MIIHETRWKCDYCGVVSPVIEEGQEAPNGWEMINMNVKVGLDTVRIGRHFCCQTHRQAEIDMWQPIKRFSLQGVMSIDGKQP